MLIIDDRIVIVHMRKAGGTSFCKGLLKVLPIERLTASFGYVKKGSAGQETASSAWPGLHKHSSAADFLAARGGSKGNYRLILISVRPYLERVASFYFYCRQAHGRDPNRYPWIEGMSFPAYLNSTHVYRDTVPGFATSAAGDVLIDDFVDYRQLGNAYTGLCEELGFPDQVLPRLNISKGQKKDYLTMYNPKNLARVKELFKEEEEFLAKIMP